MIGLKRAKQQAGKALLLLFIFLIFPLIQLLRIGANNDYIIIFVGSLISIVGLGGYARANLTSEVKIKSYRGMFLTMGALLPWLFACYLVLIKGFWSFVELRNGFSLSIILWAVLYIFLGYKIVKNVYEVTEFVKGVPKPAPNN